MPFAISISAGVPAWRLKTSLSGLIVSE